MAGAAQGRRQARKQISWLCDDGLDWVTLTREATRLLQRVVPFERVCWHPIDPSTLLLTGSVTENLPDGGLPLLTWLEYASEDVNQWAALSRLRTPVGVLSEAAEGDRTRSRRYRELLRPMGLGWELRAALVSDSSCWGALGLYRDEHEQDFAAEEAEFVASVSDLLGEGFRRALIAEAIEEAGDDPDEPGLVLLDADGQTQAISPAAQRLLDEVVDVGNPDPGRLPFPVYAVAERARRDSGDSPLQAPRARIRTRAGRWLVLHGTTLAGPTRLTAVIIEPAHPAEIAPLIEQAYALSKRERDVSEAVLRGLSTEQIASSLFISPHTVQDHLRTIFDKVGVRSRRELVARLYSDHYLPHVLANRTPTPSGWFRQR